MRIGRFLYVDGINGSNINVGNINNPFKTIQYALDYSKPNDTIYVKNGIYNERILLPKSGTYKYPIKLKNYPGHTPVVDGTGITWNGNKSWGALIDLNKKSHWIIEGLHVKNSYAMGIGVSYFVAENPVHKSITIRDCHTTDTNGSGIHVMLGEDIKIEHCTVTRACKELGHEGISINNVNGFEVKDCRVIDCFKEAIDAKDGSRNGSIHGCFVSGGVRCGIYIDAFSKKSYNIDVYENTVTIPNGVGFSTGAESGGVLKDITFQNNIVYDSLRGFNIASHNNESNKPYKIQRITIQNNTVFNVTYTGVFITATVEDVVIDNNILHPSANSAPLGIHVFNFTLTDKKELKVKNNIFKATTKNNPNLLFGDDYITVRDTDSLMVDPFGTRSGSRDFRVVASSYSKKDIGASLNWRKY
ncbi:right-handed parallel beta-helix repeat-containing protein [Bacillus sp. JJ722]|uniref:right-handed parallel beta-helix repeat-containing protein n=1 Tax=Bacillus sp. JJ722 TaxID=3122973 RepID=UPI003000306A